MFAFFCSFLGKEKQRRKEDPRIGDEIGQLLAGDRLGVVGVRQLEHFLEPRQKFGPGGEFPNRRSVMQLECGIDRGVNAALNVWDPSPPLKPPGQINSDGRRRESIGRCARKNREMVNIHI